MIFLFSNFGYSTLDARLEFGDTSARIPQGDTAKFPQPITGERFAVILQDGNQEPEIVHVMSNDGSGTITLERGKEATAAKTWPAGTLFSHTTTAESIGYFATGGFQAEIDALEEQLAAANALIAALQTQLANLKTYVDDHDGTLSKSVEQTNASITTVYTVIADNNFAQAMINETLTAEVGSNKATIETVKIAQADTNMAVATLETDLTAKVNGVDASLTNFKIAQAKMNEAFVSETTTMSAQITGVSASLTTSQTVQAGINKATADSLTTMNATIGANYSTFSDFVTVQTTKNTALAKATTDLAAVVGANKATFDSQVVAQAGVDSAQTDATTKLTARVGTAEANVTTNASAIATTDGKLTGRYGIKVDSGGVVSQMELLSSSGSSGAISNIRFKTGQFYISNPTGDVTPFVFDASTGWAYLENARIKNAVIDNLTITKEKINYSEITERLTATSGATVPLSTSIGTALMDFYYIASGGDMENKVTITIEAPGGDTYPQVFFRLQNTDVVALSWYIKGGTTDTREYSYDLNPGSGQKYHAVIVQLAPGSGPANVKYVRFKVAENKR